LNRDNDTKDVMTDDNYLRMGDTGVIDDEGFLSLTGYPQDLITLHSGDKVNPVKIEDTVKMELPCISHCLLVGEGQTNLGLLITLDTIVDTEQGLPTQQLTLTAQKWFKAARFDVKTVTDVIKNVESGIKHVIQAGIDRANQKAEKASHFIVDWDIKPIAFSLSAGEVGLTGKLNRKLIVEKYSKHIGKMFSKQQSSREVNEHQPFSHQLSQIVEEEERHKERIFQSRNITVTPVKDNIGDSLTEDDADNVKSVRFQSNLEQIQVYPDVENTDQGSEKRSRN